MQYFLTIIAHFFGDFIFQSSAIANSKRTSLSAFAKHCLIYSIFITLSLIWFAPFFNVLAAILIISISHAVIDYLKNILLNRVSYSCGKQKTFDFFIFIADQVLHLLIIIFSVRLPLGPNGIGQAVLRRLLLYFSPGELFQTGIMLSLYVICATPAAIFIQRVFILFSLENGEPKANLAENGYLIGILERFMILTLWLMGQLGAIGFVLAAKSLARFKQLDDRDFAEKYLVGTLLSVLIALLCIMGGNALLTKIKF